MTFQNETDSINAVVITLGGSISKVDLYMYSSKTDSSPDEFIFSCFSVNPNPFSSLFTVVSKNNDVVFNKIQISSLMGGNLQEFIFEQGMKIYEINMENANPGIYILKVESSSGVFVKKIIKS